MYQWSMNSFSLLEHPCLFLFDCMNNNKFFQRLINWELWNFYVLYAPISPVWFWYCLRSWSFWFFSSSNPTITFGGFEGEGKDSIDEDLVAELVEIVDESWNEIQKNCHNME